MPHATDTKRTAPTRSTAGARKGPDANGSTDPFHGLQAIAALPLALAAEGIRFAGHRLQAQADHMRAVTQCRSLSEAIEAQSNYARETMNDYQAEMTEIVQTVTASVRPEEGRAA